MNDETEPTMVNIRFGISGSDRRIREPWPVLVASASAPLKVLGTSPLVGPSAVVDVAICACATTQRPMRTSSSIAPASQISSV